MEPEQRILPEDGPFGVPADSRGVSGKTRRGERDLKAHLTLLFALLLIWSGAALAQGTPDWMTPSEETICDGEAGAAFGLCNAYCEAMDCESENAQASETACTKVKDKFTNITGLPLPCEPLACPPPPPGTTCPCADDAGFNFVLSSPGQCQDSPVTASKVIFGDAQVSATCALQPPLGGGCFSTYPPATILRPITAEEGSACMQLIRESCNPE